MAAKESADSSKKPSRKSVEYNLEKEPLQTGRHSPRVSLREKAAAYLRDWKIPRRNVGLLVVFLIALLLAVAGTVMWLFVPLFRLYLGGG